MKKLFVEDVKVGVSRGGMACGPVSGSVVAEVCIRDLEEETVKYYSLTEVEGIPNFFETDVSTYDQQIEEVDDEEFWDMLSEHTASDFTDYVDVYANQEEMELHDPDHLLIWKYLIYMVRADEGGVEQLKAKSVGKCLGDFEIPVCDVEQEYLDENGEELEDTEPDDQESLLERLNDEFSGSAIDMSNFDDLDEDESPAACYSSYVKFHEGDKDYQLQYSFWVNDDAEITSIDWPTCEKLIGEKYEACPVGEVSARRIYDVLREEMNTWL